MNNTLGFAGTSLRDARTEGKAFRFNPHVGEVILCDVESMALLSQVFDIAFFKVRVLDG